MVEYILLELRSQRDFDSERYAKRAIALLLGLTFVGVPAAAITFAKVAKASQIEQQESTPQLECECYPAKFPSPKFNVIAIFLVAALASIAPFN